MLALPGVGAGCPNGVLLGCRELSPTAANMSVGICLSAAQVDIRGSSQGVNKGSVTSGTGRFTLTAIGLSMYACSLLLCRRGFMPPA